MTLPNFKKASQQRLKEKIKKAPYPSKQKFHFFTFTHAINGLVWSIKTQPNLVVHLIFIVICVFSLWFFNIFGLISIFDIILCTILIGFVLVAELFNTSLEALSDEVAKKRYKEFIRIAKDTSAAAVLISATTAVIVGFIIFIPKLITLLYILGFLSN